MSENRAPSRNRRARRPLGLALVTVLTLVSALLLSSCGTALVENRFSVSIDDPHDQFGGAPVAVSIFDTTMGNSAEWAEKTMGVATPDAPYTTSFSSTTAKVLGDTSPSERVNAGLALPELQDKGYFGIGLQPVDGQTQEIQAPFVGYYDYNPSKDGPVDPLTVTVTSRAGDLSWDFQIQVQIPATR